MRLSLSWLGVRVPPVLTSSGALCCGATAEVTPRDEPYSPYRTSGSRVFNKTNPIAELQKLPASVAKLLGVRF
jgi:hypothetical protein